VILPHNAISSRPVSVHNSQKSSNFFLHHSSSFWFLEVESHYKIRRVTPWTGAWSCGWVWKICNFCPISWKWYKRGLYLLWNTNRKFYFSLEPCYFPWLDQVSPARKLSSATVLKMLPISPLNHLKLKHSVQHISLPEPKSPHNHYSMNAG